MVIKLSPKVKKEVSVTTKDYGYRSEKEFIEDALWHRILELKKTEFLTKTKKIREKMKKKDLTEKAILEDFDKFYHR
jgi:hypothetical protein